MGQFKDTTRYIHQKCDLFLITRSLHFQERKTKLKPSTDAWKPWLLDLMLVYSL